jgi:hypothetical protein
MTADAGGEPATGLTGPAGPVTFLETLEDRRQLIAYCFT